MGFKPGHKLSGSRLGKPNKLSLSAALIMAEQSYSPTEKLIEVSSIAMAQFLAEIEKLESGRYSPMESRAHNYLKIVLDANRELAGFVHPKLKSVEHVKEPSPLDGMTDVQKLAAMKLAITHFESQIKTRKAEDGSSAT